MDVQPVRQMRVGFQRRLPAHVRDAQGVGKGDVVERISAGPGDRAGHVGDAVMHHAVDHIGRVGMGGGTAGFKAAALIDRDIDQHRARLHAFQHVTCDQLGRGGAGDQHRADHQFRLADHLFDVGAVGKAGLGPAFEVGAQPLQHFGIAVQNGNVRAKANGHLRCVEAHHAAADHQHPARQHARHAAQQHPAPAVGLFQRGCPGLNAHPACHLAHRLEQRQGVAGAGDGFIGNGRDAGLHQIGCLLWIGGEVEVGI